MNYAIAIHGGAGVISPSDIDPQSDAAYRAALGHAVDAGYAVLEQGGTSLDAVNTAVRILEDDELFNAGRGSVFNRAGEVEMDAAIMDGTTLAAGAVAGVKHVRNPVDLARRVMQNSRHVLLIGQGAEEFAFEQGLPMAPNTYFHTDARRQQLEALLRGGDEKPVAQPDHFGTVGAVALDRQGNLAAATSTGGLTGKRPGRVGDSCIIGGGTYAHRDVCAVSATGHGELFIRNAVGHDLYALMAYRRATLAEAAHEIVQRKLKPMKAQGGIIAIDSQGNIALEFNTPVMFRGFRNAQGRRQVAIYQE